MYQLINRLLGREDDTQMEERDPVELALGFVERSPIAKDLVFLFHEMEVHDVPDLSDHRRPKYVQLWMSENGGHKSYHGRLSYLAREKGPLEKMEDRASENPDYQATYYRLSDVGEEVLHEFGGLEEETTISANDVEEYLSTETENLENL